MYMKLNKDMTGGPVIDKYGEVVGFNESTSSRTENHAFMINSEDLRTVVTAGHLLNLPSKQLAIQHLPESSPLYRGGARVGDIIQAINGHRVRTTGDMQKILGFRNSEE
eukprot:CAMPEP_0115046956 /NCGR_PEP_ID=MMETSP0216-20121206/49035_1 /TAXON_ID=223996 /ORGANISM="Protocruzia adherens, Strain Boccale" /LENGTH=108 /DNA_ID=CAMNT_0002430091 /DNA_START=300 /DNA_END=623 /DNA_ORIENTATION=+